MKRGTTILLLTAAYALMIVAVVAAFALFGVQRVQNRDMQLDVNGLGRQVKQLEEEKAELEAQLAEAEALKVTLEEKEQKISELTEQTQELQKQLEEALRYSFDVREAAAGDLVEMEELDPNALENYFTAETIVEGDKVFERINGKSYKENRDIALNELRYMKVLHYNFDHKIQVGELIIHQELVKDMQEIFLELFKNEYEIYSMYLIDNFWTGDGLSSDYESIDVNNSSAFCYRKSASSRNLSNHALGRAIDINPQQNPYITYDDEGNWEWSHENANDYVHRDTGLPHVITHDDLAFKLFDEHGFEWGGDWRSLKDYQHFEKEE